MTNPLQESSLRMRGTNVAGVEINFRHLINEHNDY